MANDCGYLMMDYLPLKRRSVRLYKWTSEKKLHYVLCLVENCVFLQRYHLELFIKVLIKNKYEEAFIRR